MFFSSSSLSAIRVVSSAYLRLFLFLPAILILAWASHSLAFHMWNESQAGIKTAGRNINNLRYAYDTTLIAESEEELKSFLMIVKEESEKAGLKLNI